MAFDLDEDTDYFGFHQNFPGSIRANALNSVRQAGRSEVQARLRCRNNQEQKIPRLAIAAINKTGLGTETTLTIVAALMGIEMAMRRSDFQSRYISVANRQAGIETLICIQKPMSIPRVEKNGRIDPQVDFPAPLPIPVPYF